MYETERKRFGGSAFDLVYQLGPLGKTEEKNIELHGQFETATKVLPLGAWSTGSWINWQKQSPFDCHWQTNFPLNDRYKWNWVPLKDGDGYLAFSNRGKGLTGSRLTVHYAEHRDDPGKPQRIRWNYIRYQCVQYYDHWAAYFFYPCGIPNEEIEALVESKCLPYAWLKVSDSKPRLRKGCVPVDDATFGLNRIFPSRVGMLRVQTSRNAPGKSKIGGVYLTRPDGSSVKLLERWVRDASMSPGGCFLAIGNGKDRRVTGITVIDVCSDATSQRPD